MRLQQIDFFRGIAVLWVVLFHQASLPYFYKMGWIGVDIFYVLSGYLVSTLIFKEYKKFGDFKPVLFLVRRGFKIYPIFYTFILLTIGLRLWFGQEISLKLLLYESTFVRNFFGGYWVHTWSLCVEEQFYFLLAFLALLYGKRVFPSVQKTNRLLLGLFLLSFSMRLANYFLEVNFGENKIWNEWSRRVHTFYCLDALCCGVFVAYNRVYNPQKFEQLVQKMAKFLLLPSLVVLSVLPYFLSGKLFANFYVSMLGLAFGYVLAWFMSSETHFERLRIWKLNRIIIGFVAWVGTYSYPLYLVHVMVREYGLAYSPFKSVGGIFGIYFLLSMVAAVLLSGIEHYFLKLRERYFPNRAL